MNDFNLKHTIEALLLSSDKPLSTEKLFKIIRNKHQITKADVLDAIKVLENDYSEKEIKIILKEREQKTKNNRSHNGAD